MPVKLSKAALTEKNRIAIEACNQSINRLENIDELTDSKETARLIQLGRAVSERTNLKQINTHLKASTTVVSPIDDNLANELNELGNRLDQKIKNDLIINATIDFITSVLDDASKLRGITDSA